MGRIIIPPKDIHYPHPKIVKKRCKDKRCSGESIAKVIGRAMEIEIFHGWGDYMRVLDLVEWQKDEHHRKTHKELRFCQFYRKAGGGDNDWIFGQGAGHMKPETFNRLIRKAANNPDYGSFEGAFDKFLKK